MYICPICKELGITIWTKFRSGTWAPATCAKCQGQSYSSPIIRMGFGMFLFCAFLFLMYLALEEHSWIPIVFFIMIWVGGELAILQWTPLVPKNRKHH